MTTYALRIWGGPNRPSPWSLLAALVLLPIFVGCAPSGTRSTAKNTPSSTDIVAPYQMPALSIQAAWGNVMTRTQPTVLPDNHLFVFDNAVTPDGKWLVGVVQPRDFISNTTRPSFMSLYNVDTGEIKTLQQLLHPQSQVLGASADDNWIVWSEAPDQPNFADWTLWAYNLQSGQVVQVARAAQDNGQPVHGPYPLPMVEQGQLLWSQAIGPISQNDLTNAVVRLDDLATGTTMTLATRAGSSILAWPWAAWDQSVPGGDGYVALKNLVTGQPTKLEQQPKFVTLYGTSMVYADAASVYLLEDFTKSTTGEQTVFSSANNSGETTDHPQYPSLNSRIVGWTSYVTTQVFDRAEKRLVTLPSPNGPAVTWVVGRLLVWLTPEPKAQQDQDSQAGLTPATTIHVIDTSTLPAPPAH